MAVGFHGGRCRLPTSRDHARREEPHHHDHELARRLQPANVAGKVLHLDLRAGWEGLVLRVLQGIGDATPVPRGERFAAGCLGKRGGGAKPAMRPRWPCCHRHLPLRQPMRLASLCERQNRTSLNESLKKAVGAPPFSTTFRCCLSHSICTLPCCLEANLVEEVGEGRGGRTALDITARHLFSCFKFNLQTILSEEAPC